MKSTVTWAFGPDANERWLETRGTILVTETSRRHLRNAAKLLLPPIALAALRRASATAGRSEWGYLGEVWPAASGAGWDDPTVVETQLSRWPSYAAAIREPFPLVRSSESGGSWSEDDLAMHNTAMAFAYVVALAAVGRDRLTMLDWGGGLGQYALLARSVVPSVEIDYHCRELPLLAAAGRGVLPHDTFHDSDASAFARTYDLVVASSSLQYVKDWRLTLGQLAVATQRYLYVTRQPFVMTVPSFVVVQRPHRYGYNTEYPGWFLNRDEFLGAARDVGLQLRREFLIWERPYVPRAPAQAQYRGFLFEPAKRAAG